MAFLRRRWRDVGSWEWGVLALLSAWALAPIAYLALHAASVDGVFTGSTGALAGADQFLYLDWIRQSGEHGLIANRFDLAPSRSVFVHPMTLVSGLLWRAGISVQLALLAWAPVAVLALGAGFSAYCRRLLPARGAARPVAVLIALLFFSPVLLALDSLGALPPFSRFELLLVSGDAMPAWQLWGYLHAALVLGLTAGCLVWLADALRSGVRRALGTAAAAAFVVSWLHPWQGVVLLALMGGVAIWGRLRRRYARLAVPFAAGLLPLAYQLVLSHTDASWRLSAGLSRTSHVPLWMLAAGLGPLVLPALAGLRRPSDDGERMLLLWPPIALGLYFTSREFPFHFLEGISLPLAVLAVRGWQRLGAGRALAVVAVAALTLPGLVYESVTLRRSVRSDVAPYALAPGERRALSYLAASRRPGGVLARFYLGMTVPAFTGRPTWVGQFAWTPNFDRRVLLADRLLSGGLPGPQARRLVARTGAAFVLADCRARADLRPVLGPLLVDVRRFGCAAVYELSPPG